MLTGLYICIALLALLSIVHIFALYTRNRKIKSITKPLLLPLIILIYVFIVLSKGERINWYIFSALVLGWIGDVILIPKSKVAVLIGGWAFLAEQIILCLGVGYSINYSNVNIGLVIFFPVLFGINAIIYNLIFIKKHVKTPVFILSSGYLAINGVVAGLATALLISMPVVSSGLIFTGAMLFFGSDALLIYVRLTKDPKIDTRHMFIMGSYIFAQLCHAIGFAL